MAGVAAGVYEPIEAWEAGWFYEQSLALSTHCTRHHTSVSAWILLVHTQWLSGSHPPGGPDTADSQVSCSLTHLTRTELNLAEPEVLVSLVLLFQYNASHSFKVTEAQLWISSQTNLWNVQSVQSPRWLWSISDSHLSVVCLLLSKQ